MKNMWPNFIKSLIAVLVGNAIYFLLLTPILPPSGRHGIHDIDFGLLIDFWVCLLIYLVLQVIVPRLKKTGSRE